MCVFHTSFQRLEVAILSSGHFFFLTTKQNKNIRHLKKEENLVQTEEQNLQKLSLKKHGHRT